MKCLRSCLTSKWAARCLRMPGGIAVLDDVQQGLRISRRVPVSVRQFATLHRDQEEMLQFGEAQPGQLEGMAKEAFDGEVFVDKLSDSRKSSPMPLYKEDVAKLWRAVCGQANSARLEDALDALDIHITPQHIGTILKSLTDLDTAIRVFLWADKHEYYAHNLITYTGLLKILAHAKEFDKAWNLLTEIRTAGVKLTSTPFSVLIKAYGEADRVDEAIHAFTVMVDSGVPGASVNGLLKVLLIAERFDLAMEIFEKFLPCRELVNSVTFDTLAGALRKRGKLQNVVEVASDTKLAQERVKLETWTMLITALSRCGMFTKALKLFSDMKNAGIKPDVDTHRIFLHHLCAAGKMDDATVHLQYMKDEGCMPDAKTYSTLMYGFCKARRLDDGRNLLNELLEHGGEISPAVFCILVDGFCRLECMDEACDMLDKMVRLGYLPSIGTYRQLILRLFKVGRVGKAFMYLKEMRENKILPNAALFHLMMEGLSYASLIIEAKQVSSRPMVPKGLAATSFSCSALSSRSTLPVRVIEILNEMKKDTMELAFD